MPALMLRPSPFCIALVALGSLLPAARADEPPCPSQVLPAAPPKTAAPAARSGAPARPQRGTGNIEITSDTANVGVDGKGAHTHYEQLYISSIAPRARLLHRLYQTLR